jgi:hypothetical protein
MIYGESAYTGRYREAIEKTSLDYQTLRNYAWVARRFPMSRRRDTLSFGHHAEVAALQGPEQDYWLRKAEELRWSRNQLRREVHTSLTERSTGTDPDQSRAGSAGKQMDAAGDLADIRLQVIQVKLTFEQLELCLEAAKKEGISIED